MDKTDYASNYININFRDHPDKYKIGKGEQGVLIAEPYKSEILPLWRFATPLKAKTSAASIYELFEKYKKASDFVGMDMARKFLQMGFTRSRRYANHSNGKKYSHTKTKIVQDPKSEASEKAESARIFFSYYSKAKDDQIYQRLKQKHKEEYEK
jgi:hypothetical protein